MQKYELEVPQELVETVKSFYFSDMIGLTSLIADVIEKFGPSSPHAPQNRKEVFGNLENSWNELESKYPNYALRLREFLGALDLLEGKPNRVEVRQVMAEDYFFVVRDDETRNLMADVLLSRALGIIDQIDNEQALDQGNRTMNEEVENIWQGTGIKNGNLRAMVMLAPDQVIDRILGGNISWHAQAWKPQ